MPSIELAYNAPPSTPTPTSVSIAGSFSNWTPKPMTPTSLRSFTYVVSIPDDIFTSNDDSVVVRYKFIVDGQWVLDGSDDPTEADSEGNWNFVQVVTRESGRKGSLATIGSRKKLKVKNKDVDASVKPKKRVVGCKAM